MHRKDYLQRQFEEFGKVLAVILGWKKEKDWEKFEQEINDAASKFTQLDLENVETMSDEKFQLEILANQQISADQKKILASLLFEKLSLYHASADDDRWEKLKLRCQKVYMHLKENQTSNEFDLDVHYKLGILNTL